VKKREQTVSVSAHSRSTHSQKSLSQLLTFSSGKRGTRTGVAATYNNIGQVYDSVGNYEKALEYYNKALDAWMREFKDETHPDICLVRHNIIRVEESLTRTTQSSTV
jgi:tetratricopeptide (TPR) repeat protein